jgi:hypothetical protein
MNTESIAIHFANGKPLPQKLLSAFFHFFLLFSGAQRKAKKLL